MPISFETVTMHRFRCKECDLESYEAVGLGELVYTVSVHLQTNHKIPYPQSLVESKRLIRERVEGIDLSILDKVN